MSCSPRPSILDGIDVGTLQTRLAQMQADYLDLLSGRKIEVAAYTQGDGNKSVTYTKANIADMVQAIIGLQSQIDVLTGKRINRRAAMAPFF